MYQFVRNKSCMDTPIQKLSDFCSIQFSSSELLYRWPLRVRNLKEGMVTYSKGFF